MPDATTIAALVTAFGVGGVAGVVLRAEHERAERRRDRMIDIAEELTVALTHARAVLHEAVAAVRRYDPSKPAEREDALHEATEALDAVLPAADAADRIVPRFSPVRCHVQTDAGPLRRCGSTPLTASAIDDHVGQPAS